jgi:hypothetical protein
MQLDMKHVVYAVLIPAFVLFAIYRRFRRNFGRQPLRPKSMIFRIVLLSVFGLFLLPAARASLEMALAIAAGLGIGVALGIWGAKHTRFEKDGDKISYIPHTYTGMVVTALFLGRLVYRFGALFTSGAAQVSQGNPFAAIQHNPVTSCIFLVLVGYYVYYYSYVLYESRHLKPGDYEKPPAAPAA